MRFYSLQLLVGRTHVTEIYFVKAQLGTRCTFDRNSSDHLLFHVSFSTGRRTIDFELHHSAHDNSITVGNNISLSGKFHNTLYETYLKFVFDS